MSYCRNCGSKIEEGMKFCIQCGTPVKIKEEIQNQEQLQKQTLETDATSQSQLQKQEQPQMQREEQISLQMKSDGQFQQQIQYQLENSGGKEHEKIDYYSDQEINSGKFMGALCYFGILALIPLFAEKDNHYVRFHVNQGMILLMAELILIAFFTVIGPVIGDISLNIYFLMIAMNGIAKLLAGIWSIIGLVNVLSGKAKRLPIIGDMEFVK